MFLWVVLVPTIGKGQVGLDAKTAQNWFVDSITELQRTTLLPTLRIMGLDEIYLLGALRAVFAANHRFLEYPSKPKNFPKDIDKRQVLCYK